MAIVRYTASADTTISNAFEENMITRGTGSNMGAADSLEVFSIYAQASTSSAELSRALVKFPTTTIASDRTAGTIPASGSVNFFLKVYNVKHSYTLPTDYKLTVARVTSDWEEGYGLDMDGYTDLTYNGEGSNWDNCTGTDVAEITKVVFGSDTPSNYGAGSGANYITIYDGPNRYNFWFDDGTGDSAPSADGTEVEVDIDGQSTSAGIAGVFQTQAHAQSGLSATIDSSTVYVTSSTAGVVTASAIVGTISGITSIGIQQTGSAATPWGTPGGDFTTATAADFVDVSFADGDEDIEVDITDIVEGWIKSSGPNANYGLMLKMSSSYETYFSSSTGANTGSVLHNTLGAKRSYYTKRFSARSSEFFFKRPAIEARWDDSRRDNRGDFFVSSSVVASNYNTLYLYNYVRGELQDFPGYQSTDPVMKLYRSSGSVPEGFPQNFKRSSDDNEQASISGTRVSKGVYKVSFSVSSSAVTSTFPYLVDVWSYNNVEFHTGSAITPKTHSFTEQNPNSSYVISVSNMREYYNPLETARFRVFVRQKDWSPTVYTKATTAIESYKAVSASYEVYRVVDDEVVIGYGTGSSPSHTRLSYDVSGNYFDLDMKLLEPGYMYGIRVSVYESSIGSYREHPNSFKFKVKRHYDY